MPFPDVSDEPLSTLTSLAGRVAVVTGGATGLGYAIAHRLAEAGAATVLGDIDERSAETAAAELGKRFQAPVVAKPLDVTSSASMAELAHDAVERFGRLDIWVNNAGIYPSLPAMAMSDEDWDLVLDTNLRGTFFGCREAARTMTSAGHGGVIVNLSSVAGLRGRGPGVGHYVASKHGIIGITRAFALEFAPDDIRVLAVAPTTILTPGVRAGLAERAATAHVPVEQLLVGHAGRAGLPDDVARVVLFCASDLSMFMTGETLVVDAGEMCR